MTDLSADGLRILLKKYIRHVKNMEGIDFIIGHGFDDHSCTDVEWETLTRLAEEVRDE